MEKLSFFTFLLVIIFNSVVSQEIILTFVPVSDTLTIDSIQATNLSTNERLTFPGGESVNLNDITTRINEYELFSDKSLVYPNPFQNYTTLQYTTKRKENIKLIMTNSAGASVATLSQNLLPGSHQFNITTKASGIYFIKIQSGEVNISLKLVSLKNGSRDRIENAGKNEEAIIKKSLNVIQTDQLILFKVFSGDNITIITDTPKESKTYEVEFYECRDADGNNYPVVKIGDQWWMAENLKSTKYRDESLVPHIQDSLTWANTRKDACCYYNNDMNNAKIYGILYNRYAVRLVARNLAPAGWHIASYPEWNTLITNLGGKSIAGGKLKETGTAHWLSPNSGATNSSGFTALPGGYRRQDGAFGYDFHYGTPGTGGHWWTATPFQTSGVDSWGLFMYYDRESVPEYSHNNGAGYSVRCVKD